MTHEWYKPRKTGTERVLCFFRVSLNKHDYKGYKKASSSGDEKVARDNRWSHNDMLLKRLEALNIVQFTFGS